MSRPLIQACIAGIALLAAPVRADTSLPTMDGPARKGIDISAHAVSGTLADCRLAGEAVLWVSRPVKVLDEAGASLGALTAGLAQFGQGSHLGGCIPDGAALNLSDRFATFLMTDGSGVPDRLQAEGLASRLAQDFYRLAEHEGTVIPLVDGVTFRAMGSASYRFRIVLIIDAASGSFDAVILRETLGTKFAPGLGEADRRLSRVKWSSIP
jgi:hypothetical protein